MKPTLVIMAAGMGSRFGGMKQIEPVGKNGEILMDYAINDAILAGFGRVVFVIKQENEQDFRNAIGDRISAKIQTEYCFQRLENLPNGFTVPAQRIKPWGTAHAVLSCFGTVTEPFCAINADDFYGRDAFIKVAQHLNSSKDGCMAGFKIENTLTENGTVSRGICKAENGYLVDVVEHIKIENENGQIIDHETGSVFPCGTLVSMNMWGFPSGILDEFEKVFANYLESCDMLKGEFYLPYAADVLIKQGKLSIKMLETDAKWYGMTYPQDKVLVSEKIQAMTEY